MFSTNLLSTYFYSILSQNLSLLNCNGIGSEEKEEYLALYRGRLEEGIESEIFSL